MRLLTPSVVLATLLAVLAPNSPAQTQESQTDTSRKVASKVIPAYPSIARSMNLSGTVRLEVVVLPSGTVKAIQVKGGNPLLAQSAQNAVHEWKWERSERDTIELVEFKFTP